MGTDPNSLIFFFFIKEQTIPLHSSSNHQPPQILSGRKGLGRYLNICPASFLFPTDDKEATSAQGLTEHSAHSFRSCPTLCDPAGGSLPDSVHGILQASILEWVGISFSQFLKESPSKSRIRNSTHTDFLSVSLASTRLLTRSWIIGSVQYSHSVLSESLQSYGPQHVRPPCPSTNSQSLLKLMSTESIMLSNHLILCRPLLFPPSIFPSIRVFSNESLLHIRWPKYWSFSFSISPANEYSGLISFRMNWIDFLEVQGTLKSLFQHHSSKASILRRSAFFIESSGPSQTLHSFEYLMFKKALCD